VTGPKGQKRPADVIGNAVRVMQIATGEAEEEFEPEPVRPKGEAAVALGRKGGEAPTNRALPPRQIQTETLPFVLRLWGTSC